MRGILNIWGREGLTEGKSDTFPMAVNRFMTNPIIISSDTMLSIYA
jgi:hypothetical protein